MESRLRLYTDERKQSIVEAAARVAGKNPLKPLRRGDVADEAKCCPSLITHYFKSMVNLEAEMIRHAVEANDIPALAYAVGQRRETYMSKEQRAQAVAHLAGTLS